MTAGYRPEIDGLRALAVIAVLLYHADVPGFSGGYVGVDVFFVISGYLVTRQLLPADFVQPLALRRFVERRVRRIVPALLVMLGISAVAACWLLMPYDLEVFGGDVVSAILLVANLRCWVTTGYFEAAIQTRPLAHTWSLSVEEQFYLLFPLLLIPTWRRWPRQLPHIFVTLASISWLCSVLAVDRWPDAAYYLLPSRAWEFLLGAWCVGADSKARLARMAEVQTSAGLLCIGLAVSLFSAATPYPGVLATLPCAGTALVLCGSAQRRTLVGRLLAWPPLVAVGLVSYSLYLWHWPLLVFGRTLVGGDLNAVQTGGALTLALGLAAVTWRWIEQPFRRTTPPAARLRLLFVGGVMVVIAGATAVVTRGWPQRQPESIARLVQYQYYFSTDEFRDANGGTCFIWPRGNPHLDPNCLRTDEQQRNVLLWGDSIAAQYAEAFRDQAARHQFHLVQATKSGCPPLRESVLQRDVECTELHDRVIEMVHRTQIDAVVIGGDWFWWWTRDREGLATLKETLGILRASGVPVWLLGQGPEYSEAAPVALARRLWIQPTGRPPDLAVRPDVIAANRHLRAEWSVVAGVTYVEVLDVVCPLGRCPSVAEGTTPLVWSTSHLTRPGARTVLEQLGDGLRGLYYPSR